MRAEKVANFISNNPATQKILKGINKNPAVYNAASAFVFASVMRPVAIGAMPFKEKKDKQYSQASAIAAGVVDLAATAAIFIPLNKSIGKAADKLTGDVFQNSKAVDQFKSVTNRGLKALTLIPVSLARFSIVRPIVDFMFGKEDKTGNPSGAQNTIGKLLSKVGENHDK